MEKLRTKEDEGPARDHIVQLNGKADLRTQVFLLPNWCSHVNKPPSPDSQHKPWTPREQKSLCNGPEGYIQDSPDTLHN